MRPVLLGVLVLVGATVASARVTIQITSCGTYVRRGQVGMLMNDLSCGHQWGTCSVCSFPGGCTDIQPAVPCAGPSDCPDPAADKCDGGEFPVSVGVRLEPGARLYMNGHSITEVQTGISGVRPDGTAGTARVRVLGPGTISKVREGFNGYAASVSDGVTVTDSLFGLAASKLRLKDVTTSDDSIGVSVFDALRAIRLTADDNRYAGILSYAGMRVSFSHATGNAVIDVTSEQPLRVTATTCDHSAALEETGTPGIYAPTGPPWGVCAGD